MTTAKDIMKQIKDNDVKFVDLRFTDPKGKRDANPRWSPDGKTILIESNRSGSSQLWTVTADGKWEAKHEGKTFLEGTVKLDPSKKPKAADWTITTGRR